MIEIRLGSLFKRYRSETDQSLWDENQQIKLTDLGILALGTLKKGWNNNKLKDTRPGADMGTSDHNQDGSKGDKIEQDTQKPGFEP